MARQRQASYRGAIPIMDVQPAVVPPRTRQRSSVDMRPYLTILKKAERVRKSRTPETGLEFIIPDEARHTLRTRLNQAGELLDIGVSFTPAPNQGTTPEGTIRMVLVTGPRRHRTTNGNSHTA